MTLKVTQEIWARNLQKESVSGPRNRQKTSVSGARNSKKRICLFSGARNRQKGAIYGAKNHQKGLENLYGSKFNFIFGNTVQIRN